MNEKKVSHIPSPPPTPTLQPFPHLYNPLLEGEDINEFSTRELVNVLNPAVDGRDCISHISQADPGHRQDSTSNTDQGSAATTDDASHGQEHILESATGQSIGCAHGCACGNIPRREPPAVMTSDERTDPFALVAAIFDHVHGMRHLPDLDIYAAATDYVKAYTSACGPEEHSDDFFEEVAELVELFFRGLPVEEQVPAGAEGGTAAQEPLLRALCLEQEEPQRPEDEGHENEWIEWERR